jgi:hypothetical protein
MKSCRKIQQDATLYQNLLFHICMKLSMFRATHHPSSGAKNCTSSIWFCVCGRLLDGGCWTLTASSNDMFNNLSQYHAKPGATSAVCGVSPKTWWASYKYGIINFDTLLHLVGFFCMNCTVMHGSTNASDYKIFEFALISDFFQGTVGADSHLLCSKDRCLHP